MINEIRKNISFFINFSGVRQPNLSDGGIFSWWESTRLECTEKYIHIYELFKQ